MAISLRLSGDEENLIREYAKMKSQSVSEVMREAILAKIEDEIDLASYEDAMRAHTENPQTYTLKEVWDMLDG